MTNSLLFEVASAQAAARNIIDQRVKKMKRRPWEEWELDILRKNYQLLGSKYCRWYLPHRSIHSIRHKAIELNLLRENKDPWSQEELDIVIKGVASHQLSNEIQRTLADHGYERTEIAVRDCRLAMMKKYQASQ